MQPASTATTHSGDLPNSCGDSRPRLSGGPVPSGRCRPRTLLPLPRSHPDEGAPCPAGDPNTREGKKTVDVQQIKERFAALGISTDWTRFDRITKSEK